MYPSIENLLRIRDGEPVDADAIAYVEADSSATAELRRLRDTQQALKGLPGFLPPVGVWERVIETAESDATLRARRRWQWPLRGAIAASVAILALQFSMRAPEAPGGLETGPSTIVGESVPNHPMTRIVGIPSYASLVEESARLDRALGSLTYRPTVMRGSTVSAITNFEDQIAVVDDRLMYANRLNLSAQQRRALYQHRVDLMNALISVRYAQAQRSGY
jgi:hypothetical protein